MPRITFRHSHDVALSNTEYEYREDRKDREDRMSFDGPSTSLPIEQLALRKSPSNPEVSASLSQFPKESRNGNNGNNGNKGFIEKALESFKKSSPKLTRFHKAEPLGGRRPKEHGIEDKGTALTLFLKDMEYDQNISKLLLLTHLDFCSTEDLINKILTVVTGKISLKLKEKLFNLCIALIDCGYYESEILRNIETIKKIQKECVLVQEFNSKTNLSFERVLSEATKQTKDAPKIDLEAANFFSDQIKKVAKSQMTAQELVQELVQELFEEHELNNLNLNSSVLSGPKILTLCKEFIKEEKGDLVASISNFCAKLALVLNVDQSTLEEQIQNKSQRIKEKSAIIFFKKQLDLLSNKEIAPIQFVFKFQLAANDDVLALNMDEDEVGREKRGERDVTYCGHCLAEKLSEIKELSFDGEKECKASIATIASYFNLSSDDLMQKIILTHYFDNFATNILQKKISAKKMAKDLNEIFALDYLLISPKELFLYNKNSGETPVLRQSINFNQGLLSFAKKMILFERDLEKRAALFDFFLEVFEESASHKNIGAMFTLNGLMCSPVIRKCCGHTERLEKANALFDKSFATTNKIRTANIEAVTKGLPNMGYYLGVFAFTRDGNPSFLPTGVNANKLEIYDHVLKQIFEVAKRHSFTKLTPHQAEFKRLISFCMFYDEASWHLGIVKDSLKSKMSETREPVQNL